MFWSHQKLSLTFSSHCNLQCVAEIYPGFPDLHSGSRGLLSPAVWVPFLLGWVCRGRSVSKLQISTCRALLLLPQGPGGGLGSGSWSPAACATSFGSWMPGWPCSLGGVGEEPLSVRRGAVPGHQPCCPQGSEEKGISFRWLLSLISLGRRQQSEVMEEERREDALPGEAVLV